MSPRDIGLALGRQGAQAMNALYALLHEMREAGDINSPTRGAYTAKVAKHAKNAQDAKIEKDAQEILNVEDVFAVEVMLRDQFRAAQDGSKDASIENNDESSHATTILSNLSHLRTTSPSTAKDVCPECGGEEWCFSPRGIRICRVCLYRANRAGLRLDEWAELEDARREREAEREFLLVMGWYRSDCARCLRPLRDRTADEIVAGAELCAECGPPVGELQRLNECSPAQKTQVLLSRLPHSGMVLSLKFPRR
jgi:hypothetical protein